ncbi:hypothetical protein MNQ95_12255 [Pseudoxanthomonas daejeonensis]|uniref:hypothetical protein n=1 Tax=Pseudoxanthomonas daejeonensis TaxID=266062 RepID=UPI001F5435B1|nr:hypothetical protein [Pseudoxanthomonas daejeonensis]UNK56910.1 hypothetical protein MNQ95_12255 [Pseudoxanthomonas daejeonensis]
MRSGGAGGRHAASFGIGWLLLALACLAIALPGKAEPSRISGITSHSSVQEPAVERASPATASTSDTATAAPATDEGEPEALPALSEPSAEKEPSGDKYRRAHGTGFPALSGLSRVDPTAIVARDRSTAAEGRLPPAHASPATG